MPYSAVYGRRNMRILIPILVPILGSILGRDWLELPEGEVARAVEAE